MAERSPGAVERLHNHPFTTANGLASNRTSCLMQNKRGFLWIETTDGLCRYDGCGFKVFRPAANDNASLLSGNIAKVMEDSI